MNVTRGHDKFHYQCYLSKIQSAFLPFKNDRIFFCQIEPFAEVTASIEGYISAYILRAGVYGDGELMRIGLPLTLSYYEGKWCLTLNARLTALELSAGIFYQWRKFSWRRLSYWAEKKILYEFETRAAINEFWTLPEKCTSHTS